MNDETCNAITADDEDTEIEPGPISCVASVGTPSTSLGEHVVGYDFDVTITVGETVHRGVVTLVPASDPSLHGLVSWGSLDNWMSDQLVKLCVGHTDRAIAHAIEQACRSAGVES